MNETFATRREKIIAAISAPTGREVVLTAVSKRQPDERIAEALAAGQKIFGENQVQEARARWQERFSKERPGLELRLIGPLQTNKAKLACTLFDVIETLDRKKLADHLARLRDGGTALPRLYVQINTGEEPQKSGILPGAADEFLNRMRDTYHLKIEGLMCIPPAYDPSRRGAGEAPGPHFALLAKIAARHGIEQLSMGMSGDYEVAAALGATHIRVGSALFGMREAA